VSCPVPQTSHPGTLTVNGWNEKLTTQSHLLPNIIHVGKSTYGAWAQNIHYSLKIILVCKTLNISGNHNGWSFCSNEMYDNTKQIPKPGQLLNTPYV